MTMTHVARWSVRMIATWCVLHLLACADPIISDRAIDTVELTPPSPTLSAGETVTMVARARDANGSTIAVSPLTWSSSDASVATVSSTGVVSAIAAGSVRIAVSARGVSATATVTVTARPTASVVMTPAVAAVRVGGTVQIRAQPVDAASTPLTGRLIVWSSRDPTVARVDADGTVTGVAPGAVTIVATCEGRSAQAAVTVTLAPIQTITLSPGRDTLLVGTDRQFAATLRDAAGVVLLGRSIVWSSSNVAVAAVTATGNVIALQPGSVTIAASSEGRVGTATVVVSARLAGTVALTPSVATLAVGSSLALQVQVVDNDGNILAGRPVTFASDAPSVATIDAAGVVTALAPGNARLSATSEGKTGVASVQVVPMLVATLEITPASTSLLVGESRQLTVAARSANGILLAGRSIAWRSGSPGVISVSGSGLVTGVAPGVALVVAESEGISTTSTVTVSVPRIATIAIETANPIIGLSGSLQLSATLRDASGALLTGRNTVWRSAAENVAFVSSTGLVVGVGVGSTIITVTAEGISASVTITVR
jgi:uncharacterized protein YjdB